MGELLWSGVTERDESGLSTLEVVAPFKGETLRSGLGDGLLGLTAAGPEFWMMVILCFGEAPVVGMRAVLV